MKKYIIIICIIVIILLLLIVYCIHENQKEYIPILKNFQRNTVNEIR